MSHPEASGPCLAFPTRFTAWDILLDLMMNEEFPKCVLLLQGRDRL
jgi:hypothetical protein